MNRRRSQVPFLAPFSSVSLFTRGCAATGSDEALSFFFLSFFLGIFLSRFLSLELSFRYGNKVPLERLTGFHRLIGFNQAAVAFSFRLQPVSEPIGFPIPLASKRPYLIFTINDLHIPLYVVRKNTETLFNEMGQTCADFLEPCDVSFQ